MCLVFRIFANIYIVVKIRIHIKMRIFMSLSHTIYLKGLVCARRLISMPLFDHTRRYLWRIFRFLFAHVFANHVSLSRPICRAYLVFARYLIYRSLLRIYGSLLRIYMSLLHIFRPLLRMPFSFVYVSFLHHLLRVSFLSICFFST